MNDHAPHAAFPSDETLAAFIDGRLDPETRRRVIEHMATCAECYDVMLAANDLREQQTSPLVVPFRRRSWTLVGLAAAAVIAVVVLFTTPLREHILPQQKSGLAALAAAAPPQRNIEGRLSGFPYRPLQPVTRGAEEDDTSPEHLKLLSVAAQVAADAKKNPTPENLHAYGVSLLMLGKWDAAVDVLEGTLSKETSDDDIAQAIRHSEDAAVLNDLSAALLARASSRNTPTDIVDAVEASERAWVLSKTPDVAWNRALAIERVGVPNRTVSAWDDFARINGDDPWRDEFKRRQTLRPRSRADLWKAAKQTIAQMREPLDMTMLQRIANVFPQQARMFCEDELLPAWGASILARDDRRSAALASEITALTREDALIRDAVRVTAGARGYVEYGDARASYQRNQIREARSKAIDAERRLRDARSSFAAAPALLIASCALIGPDAEEGRRLIVESRSIAAAERYLDIRARAAWLLGLADERLGDPIRAQENYRLALNAYVALGEPENQAAVHTLIGAVLERAGDVTSAWQHHYAALRLIAEIGGGNREHQTYFAAISAAVAHGRLAFARDLLDELLQDEREDGRNSDRCFSLMQRAILYGRMGDRADAEKSLSEASACVGRLDDGAIYERAANYLGVASVAVRRIVHQTSSVADLDIIINRYSARHDKLWLAELLTERGWTHEISGDRDAAIADYKRAIDSLAALEPDVQSASFVGTLLEDERSPFDRAIELLVDCGRADEALRIRDSAVRMTRSRLSAREAGVRDVFNARQPFGEAPPAHHATIVAYFAGAHRLTTWCYSARALEVRTARVGRRNLGRLITRFRQVVRGGADAPQTKVAGEQLSELLLGRGFGHGQVVIFSPSPDMDALPFAALTNPATGRFVVEDVISAVTSTVGDYAEAERDEGNRPSGGHALFIASGADLPFTRQEIDAGGQMFTSRLMFNVASASEFVDACRSASLIHFAGHAIVNHSIPELSALLLNGSPLYVQELTRDDLRHVRMVVVSACRTADGQPSLTIAGAIRAQGVPSVIGNLWDVDDEASALLFKVFYRELQAGRSRADALRQAQLALLGNDRFAKSSCWAAPQLLGAVGSSDS